MVAGQHILIVEGQFLIALDIQHMLEAAKAAKFVFARSAAEANSLANRWQEFDLAIVELPADDAGALELALGLAARGIPLVISVAQSADHRAIPGLAGAELVVKPFSERELLQACLAALAKNPKSGNAS